MTFHIPSMYRQGIYLTIVMALTSVSVIMTVFVLNLHHRSPHKHSVPSYLKKLFLGSPDGKRRSFRHTDDRHRHMRYSGLAGMDTHCMVKNMSLKLTLDNLAQELRDELQLDNGCAEGHEHHTSAANPSPPSATTENISELSFNDPAPANQIKRSGDQFMNGPHAMKPSDNNGSNLATACDSSAFKKANTRVPGVDPTARGNAPGPRRVRQKPRAPYEDALLSLTKLLERHEVEEKEFDDIQDWRRLAQCVDRILFVFFLVATVSSTLAVLVIVPATQDT